MNKTQKYLITALTVGLAACGGGKSSSSEQSKEDNLKPQQDQITAYEPTFTSFAMEMDDDNLKSLKVPGLGADLDLTDPEGIWVVIKEGELWRKEYYKTSPYYRMTRYHRKIYFSINKESDGSLSMCSNTGDMYEGSEGVWVNNNYRIKPGRLTDDDGLTRISSYNNKETLTLLPDGRLKIETSVDETAETEEGNVDTTKETSVNYAEKISDNRGFAEFYDMSFSLDAVNDTYNFNIGDTDKVFRCVELGYDQLFTNTAHVSLPKNYVLRGAAAYMELKFEDDFYFKSQRKDFGYDYFTMETNLLPNTPESESNLEFNCKSYYVQCEADEETKESRFYLSFNAESGNMKMESVYNAESFYVDFYFQPFK